MDESPPIAAPAPPPAATPSPPEGPRRVALVVGSGSVKCMAALGLYRVLQREGIEIELIVGCSGGCFPAVLIALGYDPEQATDFMTRTWTRELTSQRDTRGLLRALFPRLFGFAPSFGLRDDRLVMRRLHEALGQYTFADCRIPTYLTATDFQTGAQVVLSEGPLVDAIRASIAIPFVFAPYEVGGRLLTDGFLSDPLPVGVAIREGANAILAMGFESPYQSRVSSAGRFAFQVSSIMTNNLLRASFAFHGLAHHAEVVPVIPRFERRVRLFDTDKIPYVIEEGARAMEEQLPYLLRALQAASVVR